MFKSAASALCAIFILFFSLTSVALPSDIDTYWPSSPGMSMIYLRTSDASPGVAYGPYTIPRKFTNFHKHTFAEPITLRGRKVVPVEASIDGWKDYTEFYQKEKDVLLLFAVLGEGRSEPEFLPEDALMPFMKAPFRKGVIFDKPGTTITILEDSENVVVPHGEFERCLKVRHGWPCGTGITLWYAPGVGLVKAVSTTGLVDTELVLFSIVKENEK